MCRANIASRAASILFVVFVGTAARGGAHADRNAPPESRMYACWPQNSNTCVTIQSHTFTPATRAPETGPFTYTITVKNWGSSTHTAEVLCIPLAAQLGCVEPDPSEFNLAPGAQQVVTVGYTTMGLGAFKQKILVLDMQAGKADSLVTGLVTVVGVPILTHWNPLDSAELLPYDTLKILAQHASGISAATLRLLIDGQDSTSQASVTASGISATSSTLTMSGGFHTMRSYGCSVSGRCDSTSTTTFFVPGNPTVSLDDSLGIPAGEGIVGLLPGALPLPPDSLKGCPLYEGHPMIKLSQPFSYIDQFSTPVGMLFRANVNFDTTITISTVNYDYPPSDPTDCGSFTYLTPSQYDWNYWADPSPTDSIWDVYPYSDFTPPGGGIGPLSVGGGTGGGAGGGPGGGHGRGPGGGQGGSGGGGGVVIQSLPAGAMNPDSVRAWLNGTLIINNGQPVAGKGVTLVSQNPAQYQYKVSVATGVAQGFVHRYNVSSPSSDNGGWNELILAAADSTGHWTKVRSRFVQLQSNPAGALAVRPLRDFRHQAQEDCAAFGAVQCAGVTLVQAIPGFVTRDKDRSLHLVYRSASQRAKTILPYDLYVSRILRAPDSVKIVLREGVVVVSDTLRYYGTKKPAGVPDADVLWENANERRVLGAALFAPATGTNAAIRTVTAQLRSFYGTSPTFQDDTVRQEVTQLHLSDSTTSRFGPGWALAEQSRLITLNSATRRIWLSGDGSYVVFNKVGSVWVAPPGETARLKDTTIASATQVIFLDNGARIGYNATGWQLWTSDVIGNLTQFKYAAPPSHRLDSIVDPTGTRYEFVYFSSGSSKGQVSEVWIRGTGGATQKMASFTYDGSARLTVMKVWRTATTFDSTVYAYHATAPGAFVTSVTDPRSTTGAPIVTTFSYETLYWTPISILRPPDRFGAATAEYRDPFRRAVPRAGRGTTQANAERLIYPNWYKGTWFSFDKRATDFTVDRFGGPTLVTVYAPPGFMTEDLLIVDWGGNDVRRIERDSMGRVTKIVGGDPAHLMLDSVMYRYDVLGPVDTIIRNTLAYPATVTLDTTVFTYDTARVTSTAGRCTRLLTMRDAMAGMTRTIYGTSGAGVCLPIKAIGLAVDTTIFTYSSLAVGDAAGARPVSVRDPVGVTTSMQYHASTWNSAIRIRVAADNDSSRAWYNPYGWADSLKNGLGTRTYYQYDQSGRVLRAKTGTGALAPTTATFYNRSGLTDSVRVYPSSDADLATPTGTVQTTKYRYNRLGWVDSTIYPGGRRQHFLRDRNGNPVYDFPGNGSFTGRLYDWQGRISLDNPSAVGPLYSVNGDSFATRIADSVYKSLGLNFNVTLSSGQAHQYAYDNRGRVIEIRTRDVGQGLADLLVRQYEYTASGQVIRDSLLYVTDGLAVARRYQYNRRGQRTIAATMIGVTNGTISETSDTLRYVHNAVTARLDSAVARVNEAPWRNYAVVRWLYDRAGRDTQQVVTPWNGNNPGTPQTTRMTYDAAGRVSLMRTSTAAGTWYQFTSPTYSKIDELLTFTSTEPVSSGGPSGAFTGSNTYTYATNGTGRVSSASLRTGTPRATTHNYTFDVLGNEVKEVLSAAAGGCAGNGVDTSSFGTDNALLRTLNACTRTERYWNDKSGNRLVQLDTSGGVYQGVQSLLSYTARNQLFFSMSPTAQPGTYDYNWHWYDAAGRRVLSQRQQGGSWVPGTIPTGQRTFYVYDGNDVALMVVKSGTTWWVKARYVTGGLDNALAGRFRDNAGSSTQNLALVNDRQGTTLAAMRADGNQETNTVYFSRDPYGRPAGATGTGGTINPETGYAGASAPNASGGFTYLRNRWYDPKTGRFLTQDPIGLAGGVNLYSYAGNNPVAYTDPFGLSPDSIKVIGEASQAAFAMLMKLSPSFKETVRRIEDDPNAHLTIRDPVSATEQHGAAMQFYPTSTSSGTILFNVTSMNQNNADLVSSGNPVTWIHTALSSMAHEMGHAAAHFGYAPRACMSDPKPGGSGCSVDFENKIRKELPASISGGIRDRY